MPRRTRFGFEVERLLFVFERSLASEANLEMIKQVMAQRFSDMPAARGARERTQIAIADCCPDEAAGEPTNGALAGN